MVVGGSSIHLPKSKRADRWASQTTFSSLLPCSANPRIERMKERRGKKQKSLATLLPPPPSPAALPPSAPRSTPSSSIPGAQWSHPRSTLSSSIQERNGATLVATYAESTQDLFLLPGYTAGSLHKERIRAAHRWTSEELVAQVRKAPHSIA